MPFFDDFEPTVLRISRKKTVVEIHTGNITHSLVVDNNWNFVFLGKQNKDFLLANRVSGHEYPFSLVFVDDLAEELNCS